MKNSKDTDIAVLKKPKTSIKLPQKYQVILKNDDFTTMDFVIFILENVFNKSREESMRIMLNIHNKGSDIVGVYTKEIATTKVEICNDTAKEYNFPLYCTCEPIEN